MADTGDGNHPPVESLDEKTREAWLMMAVATAPRWLAYGTPVPSIRPWRPRPNPSAAVSGDDSLSPLDGGQLCARGEIPRSGQRVRLRDHMCAISAPIRGRH